METDHTHTTQVAYKELAFNIDQTIRVEALTIVKMPKSLVDKLSEGHAALYGMAVTGKLPGTINLDLNGKRVQVEGVPMETQGSMALRVCDLASLQVLLDRMVMGMTPELLAEYQEARRQTEEIIRDAPDTAFDTEEEAATAVEQLGKMLGHGPHGPHCVCPPEDAGLIVGDTATEQRDAANAAYDKDEQ